MAKRNIGATLSLKDGNFFTNMKKAVTSADGLKTSLSGMQKGVSSFSGSFKKAAGVAAGAIGAIATVTAGVAGYAVNLGSEYQTALSGIGAQTGATGAELESFGQTMKDIYSENYGDNFEDIAESISTVAKSAKDLDPSSIKEMTIDAIALRDTFGYDVQESVRAANMLMDQFGISGTQAFNLITQGAQQGLDKNGDMLDSINEYSVHFKQLGIDAEGMFNSLINGTESGTFSVDKLGDAVKEFGIRVKDGTADDSFKSLGLSVDATKQAFAEGGTAAQQAFKDVNTALFSMDDKVQQNIIGVQLYGTMWEDLGAEGVKALTDISGQADMTKSSMEQLKDVKYDNLGSALEGIKRMLVTNVMLPISQEIMPTVNGFVHSLQDVFADGKLSSGISTAIGSIVDTMGQVFGGIKTVIGTNMPSIEAVGKAFSGMAGSLSDAFSGDIVSAITNIANTAIPMLSSALTTAANAISFMANNWKILLAVALPVITPIVTALGLYKGAVAACNAYDTVKNTLIRANSVLLGKNTDQLKGLTAGQLAHNIVSKQGIAQIKLQTSLIVASGKAFVVQTANCVKSTAAMAAHKAAIFAVTVASKAATAGQWLLNAAFLASPIGWIVLGIGAVVTAFALLWNKCEGFRNFWINLWNAVKNTASSAWNGIKGAFEGIKNAVSEKFNAVKETVGRVMENAKDVVQEKLSNIKSTFGKAIDAVKNSYNEGALKPVVDKLVSAFGNVKNAIADKFIGIKDTIVQKFSEIKSGIQTVLTPVISVVTTIINGVKSVVTTVIDGIKTHISNSFNIVKTTIANIVEGIKLNFQNFFISIKTVFDNIKNAVVGVFDGIKTVISGVLHIIVGVFTLNFDTIKNGAQTVMTGITGIIDGAKNVIIGIWDAIKSSAVLSFNNIKTVVSNVVKGIKSTVKSIKDTFSSVFNSVKNTVSDVFNSIKNTISNVWNGIKNIIKTPHIVQTGTVSIAGIDTPIPKLGIEWYASGGIMTSPTVFGVNGNNAMIGGESGPEAVLPLDVLWRKLAQFADRLADGGTSRAPAVTNNVYVTVQAGTGSESDADLANRVARRIVEVLDNM